MPRKTPKLQHSSNPCCRIRLKLTVWSLPDGRNNELLLFQGWEGDRVRLDGEKAIVRFDAMPNKQVTILRRDIETADAIEAHHE